MTCRSCRTIGFANDGGEPRALFMGIDEAKTCKNERRGNFCDSTVCSSIVTREGARVLSIRGAGIWPFGPTNQFSSNVALLSSKMNSANSKEEEIDETRCIVTKSLRQGGR